VWLLGAEAEGGMELLTVLECDLGNQKSFSSTRFFLITKLMLM
jgi:hypothetical protein